MKLQSKIKKLTVALIAMGSMILGIATAAQAACDQRHDNYQSEYNYTVSYEWRDVDSLYVRSSHSEVRTCKKCGEVYYDYLSAHKWDSTGEKCTLCGYDKASEKLAATKIVSASATKLKSKKVTYKGYFKTSYRNGKYYTEWIKPRTVTKYCSTVKASWKKVPKATLYKVTITNGTSLYEYKVRECKITVKAESETKKKYTISVTPLQEGAYNTIASSGPVTKKTIKFK